jgi:PleD family two-component response regulator
MANILVVDDSITMREELRMVLTEAEYTILEAVDGGGVLNKRREII